jgi:hypothetical protein
MNNDERLTKLDEGVSLKKPTVEEFKIRFADRLQDLKFSDSDIQELIDTIEMCASIIAETVITEAKKQPVLADKKLP